MKKVCLVLATMLLVGSAAADTAPVKEPLVAKSLKPKTGVRL